MNNDLDLSTQQNNEELFQFDLLVSKKNLQALFNMYGDTNKYKFMFAEFLDKYQNEETEEAWKWLVKKLPRDMLVRFIVNEIFLTANVMESAERNNLIKNHVQ